LTCNGIVIRKFFLHVSPEEQRKRFLERLEQPHKNWKFSVSDAREREHWGDYMDAYEQMIQHTSHAHAPWFVVPADNKWFTRLVVAGTVIDALQEMDLSFPKVDPEKRKELQAVREILEGERSPGKKKT
jgi:polyphosphate kinase 2 (PPK2 family)